MKESSVDQTLTGTACHLAVALWCRNRNYSLWWYVVACRSGRWTILGNLTWHIHRLRCCNRASCTRDGSITIERTGVVTREYERDSRVLFGNKPVVQSNVHTFIHRVNFIGQLDTTFALI